MYIFILLFYAKSSVSFIKAFNLGIANRLITKQIKYAAAKTIKFISGFNVAIFIAPNAKSEDINNAAFTKIFYKLTYAPVELDYSLLFKVL